MIPDTAMAMKHQRATAENRRADTSAYAPPRNACANSASRPPAHSEPARRWINRLLVAMSCDPPAEACPLRPSGTSVSNDPAKSSGVQFHRSTMRAATVTPRARNAVQRQADAVTTRSAACQMSTGLR